jgi:hypothetical protein
MLDTDYENTMPAHPLPSIYESYPLSVVDTYKRGSNTTLEQEDENFEVDNILSRGPIEVKSFYDDEASSKSDELCSKSERSSATGNSIFYDSPIRDVQYHNQTLDEVSHNVPTDYADSIILNEEDTIFHDSIPDCDDQASPIDLQDMSLQQLCSVDPYAFQSP